MIGTRPLVLGTVVTRSVRYRLASRSRPVESRLSSFERSIASRNRSSAENRTRTGHLIYDISAESVRVSNGSQSERAEQLRALHETTREMMAAETLETVAEIAICAASDILGFSANAIHFYEGERGLVPVAATDRTREIIGDVPVFAEGESIAWRVYRTGEAAIVEDVLADPDVYNPQTPIRSEIHLPLGTHGIFIAGSETPSEFDAAELSLGQVFAANIESALEQVERKRELLRQNERLEEFAGVVSHDLRNPLTLAQGYLALARQEGMPEQFDRIEAAHDRMERLINDILYLAREGDAIGETETVALSQAIDAAWPGTSDEGEPAELVVRGDLGAVTADHGRLCQLLENVFRNAIEHAGPDVTVTVERIESGFAVSDDGPGIPTAERDRVFERGYSTQETGTGYGLSIVADIVGAHGWDVRLTESDSGGARFEISDTDLV